MTQPPALASVDGYLADLGIVSLRNSRLYGLRSSDVQRGSLAGGRFHEGQSLFFGVKGIAEQLHFNPVGVQKVDAPRHAVVHDVVNRGVGFHQALMGFLQSAVALYLEREVVQADLPFLAWLGPLGRFEQGEVVVYNPTGQKGTRAIRAIPGHLKTHHVTVECGRPCDISDIEYEMADLLRYAHDDSSLACGLAPRVLTFQLWGRPLKPFLLHLQPRLPAPGAV